MPQSVESAWYAWWKKAGFFEPRPDDNAEVFSMPMPPPNVTGALHMGHALTISIQDTLIRWNRMLGKKTLWTPGCDHAGIATQNVVENMLSRREGRTRHDVGREKFIELAHEWKEEHHARINDALERMGASVDWTREAFTMDDNFTAAVQETFVRLHEEGLIYRSDRLVNWCPKLNTAISNLEVVNMEIGGRTFLEVPGYEKKIEFGVLHHIKYRIGEPGGVETIEIATTRPESIFGDTGIAVHPDDGRHQELIGKHAKHPFLDRLLPIVADESVSMDFGTGAVKVTPAHDFNDFAVGQRHGLDIVSIFNDDGTLNDNAGSFAGMKRFDARPAVIEQLKAEGLYVKWVSNPMSIPLCDRSKDFIERRLKPQWWMKTTEMATATAQAVREGQIKILPETAEKSFSRWMDDCQDWCLSRQLWWGHRVPAYFVDIDGQPADSDDNARWVTGRTESEARAKAAAKFPGQTFSLRQDPDVLDTWLSAALWPFASLGWPKETTDLKKFYPQSVLETGWDILFFWVARMVMLGLKLTGQVPFKEVYCHSLIRDSEGRKMSKSLGNVIDPIDVMDGIELQQLHAKLLTGNLDPKELATATKYQKTSFPQGIPDCGADALRFNLLSYMTGGTYKEHFLHQAKLTKPRRRQQLRRQTHPRQPPLLQQNLPSHEVRPRQAGPRLHPHPHHDHHHQHRRPRRRLLPLPRRPLDPPQTHHSLPRRQRRPRIPRLRRPHRHPLPVLGHRPLPRLHREDQTRLPPQHQRGGDARGEAHAVRRARGRAAARAPGLAVPVRGDVAAAAAPPGRRDALGYGGGVSGVRRGSG